MKWSEDHQGAAIIGRYWNQMSLLVSSAHLFSWFFQQNTEVPQALPGPFFSFFLSLGVISLYADESSLVPSPDFTLSS